MTTLYCRTETRDDAEAILEPLGLSLHDEDGNARNYVQDGETIVDVIGSYMVSPPTEDELAVMDGRFHFNVYNATDAVTSAVADVTMTPPVTPLRALA